MPPTDKPPARDSAEDRPVLEEFGSGTDAGAVIDFARDVGESEQFTVPVLDRDEFGAQLLVLPRGRRVIDLEPYLEPFRAAPRRRDGVAIMRDIDSFVAHVNRFKDQHTALFADPTPSAPVIVAVLDYHEDGAAGAPRFGKHRTRYAFPLSDEWQAWTKSDGAKMSQADFAAFIEEHIQDIGDPASAGDTAKEFAELIQAQFASASKLLELSRGLNVTVESRVNQAVNLASGEVQMSFTEAHKDGASANASAPIKVPGAFLVTIPVFKPGIQVRLDSHEPEKTPKLYRHKLAARLRYRVQGGHVTWWYSLYRVQENFDAAIAELCRYAQNETGVPLFVGSPE